MTLPVPIIDDRNYEEILAEALARIPVHNPAWTNFNESDPGITLIQLFAFMSESILYRANRIPERNRRKFLSLLGVPLQPATAATGLVTFSNPNGPLQVETISTNLTLQAGTVPFRTLNGLDVLPIEGRVFYKKKLANETLSADLKQIYEDVFEDLTSAQGDLVYYETTPLEPPLNGGLYPEVAIGDTLGASLWIALFARSNDDVNDARSILGGKTLTLGILPALTDHGKNLPPAGTAETIDNQLVFKIPKSAPLSTTNRRPQYSTLISRSTVNPLVQPGTVEIQLPPAAALHLWDDIEPTEMGTRDFPPAIEETDLAARIITWIRVQIKSGQANEERGNVAPTRLSNRLSWIGLNAARVAQRVEVAAETVGRGSGEPDQVFTLVNTPVIPGSVRLTIDGVAWAETEDLLAAASEVVRADPRAAPGQIGPKTATLESQVFSVDRESGTIQFGDGLRGSRPPRGALIRASYAYGGGSQGNLGIQAITKSSELPSTIKVTNEIATWGGAEAETVAEAEKRIPLFLQHRDRLVNLEDFAAILQRVPGVDLGRFEVLPLRDPVENINRAGAVTVLVIPERDPLFPNAPRADGLFLDAVCRHLDSRRLVTTELYIRGPQYLPLYVSIGIELLPGVDGPPVREKVIGEIQRFLSPLVGGFEQSGWPLEKTVDSRELWTVAARVPGVAAVRDVLLAGTDGGERSEIELTNLFLPELAGIGVQLNADPLPITELLGTTQPTDDGGDGSDTDQVIVPVLSIDC